MTLKFRQFADEYIYTLPQHVLTSDGYWNPKRLSDHVHVQKKLLPVTQHISVPLLSLNLSVNIGKQIQTLQKICYLGEEKVDELMCQLHVSQHDKTSESHKKTIAMNKYVTFGLALIDDIQPNGGGLNRISS